MRSRPSLAFRPRRLLAVAGLVSLGGGLLLLTTAAPSAGATASAGAATAVRHAPTPPKPSRASTREAAAQAKQLAAAARSVAVSHSSTTVQGPHMWDPSLNADNPNPSTVTVTQTNDLVNQQIQVSWTNFTPSTAQVYNNQNVAYPVMVAECKGTNPASPAATSASRRRTARITPLTSASEAAPPWAATRSARRTLPARGRSGSWSR
jgi:hypothetical protein